MANLSMRWSRPVNSHAAAAPAAVHSELFKTRRRYGQTGLSPDANHGWRGRRRA